LPGTTFHVLTFSLWDNIYRLKRLLDYLRQFRSLL
jgi:hypothetical protein